MDYIGEATMLVVCKEHLELAIDRFVDEYEAAPDIMDVSEVHVRSRNSPPVCEEKGCSCQARYVVAKREQESVRQKEKGE